MRLPCIEFLLTATARLTCPYDCNIYFGMFHGGKEKEGMGSRAPIRAPLNEGEDRERWPVRSSPNQEWAREEERERKRERCQKRATGMGGREGGGKVTKSRTPMRRSNGASHTSLVITALIFEHVAREQRPLVQCSLKLHTRSHLRGSCFQTFLYQQSVGTLGRLGQREARRQGLRMNE